MYFFKITKKNAFSLRSNGLPDINLSKILYTLVHRYSRVIFHLNSRKNRKHSVFSIVNYADLDMNSVLDIII